MRRNYKSWLIFGLMILAILAGYYITLDSDLFSDIANSISPK